MIYVLIAAVLVTLLVAHYSDRAYDRVFDIYYMPPPDAWREVMLLQERLQRGIWQQFMLAHPYRKYPPE